MVPRISTGFAFSLLCVSSALAAPPQQLFKVSADDGLQNDWFGWSAGVGTQTAVVGAFQGGENGVLSGSVYVYDLATGAQRHELVPLDTASADTFGYSVSVSGTMALCGAPYDDDNGGFGAGSVYLYDTTSGQQQTKLLASDGVLGDLFGWSVALEGSSAVIGARGAEAAYVFDVAIPQELRKLVPLDPGAGDAFGYVVALSGTIAIVGAPYDDDLGTDSGSVYVFDALTGQQFSKLLPSDGAAGDLFGSSLALEGQFAVIGAPRDDDHGDGSGAAYVFNVFSGQQVEKLVPSDGAAGDSFGWSVAMNGATAAVGAHLDDDGGANAGSVYLYDVFTGAAIAKLRASDGGADDFFGWSVAMNGPVVVAGAVVDDANGSDSGSAYVLREVPGTGFCFGGSGCPCGNDVPAGNAGCRNSLGIGATLRGTGSRSASADDLVLTATGCPPGNTGLYFMGAGALAPVAVGDGLACTGGLWRYFPGVVDAGGAFVRTTPVASALPGAIVPGATRYFQAWTRDVLCGPPPFACASPCGSNGNLSNAYAVTFSP